MKVAIIDDELYVRKKIKKILELSELDISEIYSYSNGENALINIEKDKPDIILVDINMPKLNGLDFIKQAKEQFPKTKFAIISGYNYFDYVQKAIKYGVKDYLLKPIDKRELCKLTFDLINELKKEKLKEKIFEQRGKQAKKYLLKLLLLKNSELENSFIRESLESFDSPLCSSQEFFVCSSVIDDRHSEQELNEFNNIFIDIANNIFSSLNFEIFKDNSKRIIIIFCGPFSILEKKLKQVLHLLYYNFNLSYSVGLSSMGKDLNNLYILYKESLNSLNNKFVGEKKVILKKRLIEDSELKQFSISKKVKDSLLIGLRKCDYIYLEEILNELFDEIKSSKIRIDYLRIISIHLLEPCMLVLEEREKNNKVLNFLLSIYNGALLERDIDNMFFYIKGIYKKCCLFDNFGMENIHPSVKKVMDFVENNYDDSNFSIDEISSEIGINYNYLCTLFKRSVNLTINEYLNEYRMSKALELINVGNYNISEIAEKVGFSNVSYFTRCFKKKFSVSPSKFKIK